MGLYCWLVVSAPVYWVYYVLRSPLKLSSNNNATASTVLLVNNDLNYPVGLFAKLTCIPRLGIYSPMINNKDYLHSNPGGNYGQPITVTVTVIV